MRKMNNKGWVPCFLCGNQLEIRNSKREKPYIVCDPCGVQIFIRRKEGINLLKGLLNTFSCNGNSYIGYSFGNPKLLALVNRMEHLQEKRRELASKEEFFDWKGTNQGIQVSINALDREIEKIKEQLESLKN